MKCISGKTSYHTKEMAEEALIQHRSRHFHRLTSGPINVYQCDDCGEFHFTSKGPIHPLLQSEDIQKEIKLAQEASHWEGKFRR